MSAEWVRAIDDEMTSAHIGIADDEDKYEQARDKLKRLISWHISVATDPAVNGGFALVPIEPTMFMRRAAQDKLAAEGLIVSDWLVCTAHSALVSAAIGESK